MSGSSLIRFTQSCPTCGRRVRIRGAMLGRVVACGHCNAEFIATATQPAEGALLEANRLLGEACAEPTEPSVRDLEHSNEIGMSS